MCIGIPMQIERGDGFAAVAVSRAPDGTAERQTLDMLIVGQQQPGTWVLAFHGAARRVLDPLEARQIADALAALAVAVDAGPAGLREAAIDAMFADLIDRTPQLPEHLRSR